MPTLASVSTPGKNAPAQKRPFGDFVQAFQTRIEPRHTDVSVAVAMLRVAYPNGDDKRPLREAPIAEHVESLWPGWCQVREFSPPVSGIDQVWVFSHPQLGWGVTYAKGVTSPYGLDATLVANAASAPTLTDLCFTLMSGLRTNPNSEIHDAKVCSRLLGAPSLAAVLAHEGTVTMLALAGHVVTVADPLNPPRL